MTCPSMTGLLSSTTVVDLRGLLELRIIFLTFLIFFTFFLIIMLQTMSNMAIILEVCTAVLGTVRNKCQQIKLQSPHLEDFSLNLKNCSES